MEVENGRDKKSKSILKKLERYLSKSSKRTTKNIFTKSRSWHNGTSKKDYFKKSTPNGCFSVHVGPEKQRFVIKTEFANHPLFRMLLEDAELEYGFKNEGPLHLPCDVDLFYKVLAEMDSGDQFDRDACGYGYGCSSPFLARSRSSHGYGLLTPPLWLKINNFYG
ncbi:indole-3-acetic acid-induced protein arg7 [Phtheirospermum japonicum]|uniref:Indole-3-acetic acid-induced protein arg7 n=1 Tax=Phtheirospermum japonicum TaxID=374723 RepID=A0A830C0E0_9LAMI|nr:indole-3-acetic acid-induced protein arg7 [Phtheirospermum japonicum]